jgi:signal transduction histidine kinase
MRLTPLPIRARITAAFALVMLVLLALVSVLAYRSMSGALLDEIDSNLRFRASALESTAVRTPEVPDLRLQEPREAFDQFVAPDGRVLRATRGFGTSVVPTATLAGLTRPTFLNRDVAGAGATRILVVPLRPAGSGHLVVGTSSADRSDALRRLVEVLGIGGAAAIAVACLAGWFVAGWALDPVERIRRQASAITASGYDRRMPVPAAKDELRRLALTLNDMLDRLARSMSAERGFLERAGHELRTPLSALRTEVDLALRRPRDAEQLTAAMHSVSEEIDRLARLADDLLVLARAADGRLPIRREPIGLRSALESAAALFAGRAAHTGVALQVDAPDARIYADPVRLRQALVNLVDNALRYTPPGGTVRITGRSDAEVTAIAVADDGPGFAATTGGAEQGLGLRIVRTVIEGHGGTLRLGTGPDGGALAELTVPSDSGVRESGVRP